MDENICSVCGKYSKLKCGTCKLPYCSKECQVKDWPRHKEFHKKEDV